MSAFMHYSWPARQLRERIKDRNVVDHLLKSARKVSAEHYFRNVQPSSSTLPPPILNGGVHIPSRGVSLAVGFERFDNLGIVS